MQTCPGQPTCKHWPSCGCRVPFHGQLCDGCLDHATALGLGAVAFRRRFNLRQARVINVPPSTLIGPLPLRGRVDTSIDRRCTQALKRARCGG